MPQTRPPPALPQRVMVVVDARHGIKVSDRQMLQFLSKYNVRFQVVLNKTDSVSAEDLARRGRTPQRNPVRAFMPDCKAERARLRLLA